MCLHCKKNPQHASDVGLTQHEQTLRGHMWITSAGNKDDIKGEPHRAVRHVLYLFMLLSSWVFSHRRMWKESFLSSKDESREDSRYTWPSYIPSQAEQENTDGGCLPHFKKKESLLLLFSPGRIQHPTVSLLWGGDEVTNVGQAIRTPRWAKLFQLEGNTTPLSVSCLHTTRTPPPPSYSSSPSTGGNFDPPGAWSLKPVWLKQSRGLWKTTSEPQMKIQGSNLFHYT